MVGLMDGFGYEDSSSFTDQVGAVGIPSASVSARERIGPLGKLELHRTKRMRERRRATTRNGLGSINCEGMWKAEAKVLTEFKTGLAGNCDSSLHHTNLAVYAANDALARFCTTHTFPRADSKVAL